MAASRTAARSAFRRTTPEGKPVTMSLASAKRILMPATVVLSVGWSALAVGFAWLTAPDAGAFRAAWQAQGSDPIAAEQTLRAAAAAHAGATFGASPPKRTLARPDTAPSVVADRSAAEQASPAAAAEGDVDPAGSTVKGIDHARGARSGIALFAAFTVAVWLLPIAALWAVVWIFAGRSGRQRAQ